MRSVAIITARGGSKRIPKKNIKEFCGKPIIAYSIEAALNSRVFDEVMVSTDSEEIRDIAERYGAKIPFLRSEKTSNDFSTTADVIAEVLGKYDKMGIYFDSFACIYPTAPFITENRLREAMTLLSDADAVITIAKYSFPPQRAFILNEGVIQYQNPEFEKIRSQDLEPIYHDCGQFYICKSQKFKEKHSLVLQRTKPIIVPEEEVQDIDTLSDWAIAEEKYRVLNQ